MKSQAYVYLAAMVSLLLFAAIPFNAEAKGGRACNRAHAATGGHEHYGRRGRSGNCSNRENSEEDGGNEHAWGNNGWSEDHGWGNSGDGGNRQSSGTSSGGGRNVAGDRHLESQSAAVNNDRQATEGYTSGGNYQPQSAQNERSSYLQEFNWVHSNPSAWKSKTNK